MARRGLKIGIAAVLLSIVVAAGLAWVLYPKIGVWVIRTRVLPKVAKKLDRDLAVRSIVVDKEKIVLEGVTITNPSDPPGSPPVANIERITVDYDFWRAVRGDIRLGTLTVEAPAIKLVRRADGTDNYKDLLDRLKKPSGPDPHVATSDSLKLPKQILVHHGTLTYDDELRGMRAGVDSFEGTAEPHGHAHLAVGGLIAKSKLGPTLSATALTIDAEVDDPRGTLAVAIEGGSASLWPKMSLTGIKGTVAAGAEPGRAKIALEGGYGGADEVLWHADGWVDPYLPGGDLHLRADRFTLEKIEKVLEGTPLKDVDKTSIGASLDLSLKDGQVTFAGGIEVAGLTIYHPWLAEQPVRDLGFKGNIAGVYTLKARTLELDNLSIVEHGLTVKLDGFGALPGGEDEGGIRREKGRVKAHLVVPQVACQTLLDAFPKEIVPRLQGFKLKGNFDTDLKIDVDWANLDALELGGSVGIFGCKATKVPEEFAKDRLLGEFDHFVEVEENDFTKIVVGPSNPDFVPLTDVSVYLTNSLQTTEDANFMHHHGFITREFKSALISNLKAGYFQFGASSITMQLVKNVFLYREKTLSRKLQELFLTWYVETILPKERLLEIYVNVIEFGPGIYGIGPAARHYFGKTAKDLNPVESAFFSSILPNPKQRYMQYCKGELTKWGDAKVQKIVKTMHDRKLLTDEEFELAQQTPLVFDRTEALPEDKCREMVLKMIKKSRPTTPGQTRTQTEPPPKAPKSPKTPKPPRAPG